MRYLKFKVSGQNLRKEGNFDNVIVGSKGYLIACFDFDSEWNKLAKVAVFKTQGTDDVPAIIASNGMCKIPDAVTDGSYIEVKVVGKSKDKSMKVITNEVFFMQSTK